MHRRWWRSANYAGSKRLGMGKTFTYPQPDWFPLHELPFRVARPRPELAEDDPNFDPFERPAITEKEIAIARADEIARKFDLKNGFRFIGVERENNRFVFQQNDAGDGRYHDDDNIAITVAFLKVRSPGANSIFNAFGEGARQYAAAAIADAVDLAIENHKNGFEFWARSGSPSAEFKLVDRGMLKFIERATFCPAQWFVMVPKRCSTPTSFRCSHRRRLWRLKQKLSSSR